MEMKPFQIILMAVFGITALAGIFLFANFQGFNSGVVPLGPVTIWGTLPQKTMTDALNNLKASHGELSKVTYVERPMDTFATDLSDAIASGRGPDLILISQEQLASQQDKINLIPDSSISKKTFRDTYLPEAEIFLMPKGTYGVPFLLDPLVMYYNRGHLSQVGIATPPITWEAVQGISPALTRLEQGGDISRSGVALGTVENIENARALISLFLIEAGYSITERGTDSVHSTLTNPIGQTYGVTPAVSALNYYLQFSNPSKTTYSWNRSLKSDRQAFLAGDLSLYFGFSSEEPLITAGNPNLDFDMAAMPIPGTTGVRATYGRVYAFAIPKASQNQSGAFRAAMSLTSKDVVTDIAHSLRMAPAQRALLTPKEGDLFEPIYFPQALVARGWLSPAPEKTDALFATMVSDVASGRQSIQESIVTLDQALSAALR